MMIKQDIKEIRVLFVNQSSNHGGAEIVIADIYRHIRRIEKYIIGPQNFIINVLGIQNSHTYNSTYFGNIKRRKSKLWALLLFYNILPASFEIIKICRKNKINIIHANNYTSIIFCLLPKLFCKIKIIWHCHDTIVHHNYEKKIKLLLAKYSDLIICVSKNVKKHLLTLGVPENKSIIIYNAVDIGRYEYNPKFTKSNNEYKLLSATSSFNENKGIHIIIQAINDLKNNAPKIYDKIRLNIYGDIELSIDNYYEKLIDMIENYGLNDKIRFKGFDRNLIEKMTKHHICIISTQYNEAFSLTCLESMVANALVISSDTGGLKEIIEHNYNGFIFNVRDHKTLANTIIKAIKNKDDISNTLTFNAKKFVKEKFSFDNYINMIQKTYYDLLIS